MKAALLVALLALACVQVHASSAQIIKQRAKDLRDENNARQGVPPPANTKPGSAAPSPAPAPAPATVVLTPQQSSLRRLNTAISAIKPGTTLNDSLKQNLARELLGAARGTKPSSQSVSKLTESLSTALNQKLLAATTSNRLLKNLDAVLNPGAMPAAQLKDVVNDIQALFVSSGVSAEIAAQVAADAATVANIPAPKK